MLGKLIPIGVQSAQWRTSLTPEESRQRLKTRRGPSGLRVYGPEAIQAGSLELRVGSGLLIYQRAQIDVLLQADQLDPSATRVIAHPGLRAGAVFVLAAFSVVAFLPFIFLYGSRFRLGLALFAVVAIGIVVAAILVTARIEVWSAMKQLRAALPEEQD